MSRHLIILNLLGSSFWTSVFGHHLCISLGDQKNLKDKATVFWKLLATQSAIKAFAETAALQAAIWELTHGPAAGKTIGLEAISCPNPWCYDFFVRGRVWQKGQGFRSRHIRVPCPNQLWVSQSYPDFDNLLIPWVPGVLLSMGKRCCFSGWVSSRYEVPCKVSTGNVISFPLFCVSPISQPPQGTWSGGFSCGHPEIDS